MTASHATSGTRPHARPIPGATWAGHVLDAGEIAKELTRLWGLVTVAGTRPVVPPPGAEEEGPIGVLTRASTLNLTAVARSRHDAERVERTVTRLGDLYPSRATILVADPAITHRDDPGLDVRVALLEQEAIKGRPAVRFESVVVEVHADDERQLASIAEPLLVADLPDFVWWAADSTTGSELFADLCGMADRLIVDSGGVVNPAGALVHLAAMLAEGGSPPRLSDFAWQRLEPWRTLIAQFFDPPALRPALEAIDEVRITYGAAGPDGRTGFTGALLLAGWLGSRLGWQSPGELVRPRGDTSHWRATLRAGARQERREVALVVEPALDPVADCGLAAVSLLAGGAGTFRIERFDPEELATISQASGAPTSRRMVYAAVPDEAALLAEELRHFGRDGVFEEALAFAATLAPDVALSAPA